MAENLGNGVSTTLTAPMTNSDLSASVLSSLGFPDPNFRIRIDDELMLVTSKGLGTTWTVTRGVEGTAAVAHNADAEVTHILTKDGLDQFVAERVASGISSHEAAGDPHPQYTTTAEAAAAAPVQSVAGKTGDVALGKADVGLGNVDNVADVDKPVSTAQQTAVDTAVSSLGLPSPAIAATYLRRADNNSVYETRTPQQVADELLPLFARNGDRILNGGFDVWQEGSSFSAIAVGTYFADVWRLSASSAAGNRSLTIAKGTYDPFAPNIGPYFCTLTYSAVTAPFTDFISTYIEDVRSYAGQTITLSFSAVCDAVGQSIDVTATQSFGSGGSAAVAILDSDATVLTTQAQRITVTFDVPSVVGKAIGGGSFLRIDIRPSVNANCLIHFGSVKIDIGSVATPYIRENYGDVLQRTMRYIEVSTAVNGNTTLFWSGNATQSAPYYVPVSYKVQKRVVAAVTLSNQSVSGFGAITVGESATDGFRADSTASVTGPAAYFRASWKADARF